ncbi:hypothetical protein K502DRAFT_326293 [Neoconidiobolus thromboides FSU 785]|nr:hypothetical protein K502DRAFT_326293 [Neoconidiobolus thromboides FSU 785]
MVAKLELIKQLSLKNRVIAQVLQRSYKTNARNKETPFIPGVQGYSPDFSPPPPPKRKEKKVTKIKKIVPKIEVSGKKVQNKEPVTEIANYKQTLTVLRKQYFEETKTVEEQRVQEALKQLKLKEEAEQKEKDRLEKLANETTKKREQDYLSSLNVFDKEELKAASGTTMSYNPFTDPEAKSKRIENKKQNLETQQEELKRKRKEALLQKFYQAKSFVTPNNIDDYLRETIDKQGSSFSSGLSFLLSSSKGSDPSLSFDAVNRNRFNILQDTLNNTINGQPNVDYIQENKNNPSNKTWTLENASKLLPEDSKKE